MGVNVADCRKVAELLGIRLFIHDLFAYLQVAQLIRNRGTLERHVTNNGTWYWHGDDVILTSPELDGTVGLLKYGVITVILRFMLSMVCEQYFLHVKSLCV